MKAIFSYHKPENIPFPLEQENSIYGGLGNVWQLLFLPSKNNWWAILMARQAGSIDMLRYSEQSSQNYSDLAVRFAFGHLHFLITLLKFITLYFCLPQWMRTEPRVSQSALWAKSTLKFICWSLPVLMWAKPDLEVNAFLYRNFFLKRIC